MIETVVEAPVPRPLTAPRSPLAGVELVEVGPVVTVDPPEEPDVGVLDPAPVGLVVAGVLGGTTAGAVAIGATTGAGAVATG